VVSVNVSGLLEIGARVGTPCFHNKVIRYQWLFFMLMAPPVEKSRCSQCWASCVRLVTTRAGSANMFSSMVNAGLFAYVDVTPREVLSTKETPVISTMILRRAEQKTVAEIDRSREVTITQ
jgi:hypothetical protein